MNPFNRTSTFLSLFLTVCLAACTSDYMDMSTAFRSELCVVKSSVGQSVSLYSDMGRMLNPISELDSAKYKPGTRYLVTYIVLDSTNPSFSKIVSDSYSIRVKELQSVLVKPIMRADELPSPVVDEDPIKLLSKPWLGGGFLNMEFMLRYDNENPDMKHAWLMLIDSTKTEGSSKNTYLTFIHDAHDDGQAKSASTLVSFDCDTLLYREQPDSLFIRVYQWDADNRPIHTQLHIENTTKAILRESRFQSGIH